MIIIPKYGYRWNKKNQVFFFNDVSKESIYSYLKLNNESFNVLEIKEKVKISNQACSGKIFSLIYMILSSRCVWISILEGVIKIL